MLRVLRILGIVVFAVIVGISANNLWDMHQTGELTERYNSARKANVTMLVFSIMAVVGLGCAPDFEGAQANDALARDPVEDQRSASLQADPGAECHGADQTRLEQEVVFRLRRDRREMPDRAVVAELRRRDSGVVPGEAARHEAIGVLAE